MVSNLIRAFLLVDLRVYVTFSFFCHLGVILGIHLHSVVHYDNCSDILKQYFIFICVKIMHAMTNKLYIWAVRIYFTFHLLILRFS